MAMLVALSQEHPLNINDSVIPKGSWVLVTGINGFIGSHVGDQLLAAGFRVRGAVRNAEKCKWLCDLFASYGKNNFSLVGIADMTVEGALDEAGKDVEGVIHVASPVNMNPDPNVVVPTAINAALNVLKSAAKSPSAKRFVLTSSSMAAYTPQKNKPMDITVDTWNEDSVQAAFAPPPYDESRGFVVYGASKTRAEQEIWKWCRENKPTLVANAVLPNLNIGTMLDVKNQGFPSSVGMLKSIWENDLPALMETLPPQYFVNVQDCARLHVAALVLPEVKNERVFAFTDDFTYNDLLVAFRKAAPGRRCPDDLEKCDRDLAKVPNERAEELLKKVGRKGWISLDESVRNLVPAHEQGA